jgi:hypothetical protein
MGAFVKKPLDCGGHACPKCGRCRDWYHNGSGFTMRDDATCSGDPGGPYHNGVKDRHGVYLLYVCRCKKNTVK